MRIASLAVLGATLMAAAACVSVTSGPTSPPGVTDAPSLTAEPTAVQITQPPTIAPEPTPVITLAPGATASPDIRAILNASMTVFNLSDSDLSISAVIHDPSADGGSDIPIADFTLAPDQATTRSVIGGSEDAGALTYVLTFTSAGTGSAGGSCTLAVLDGQEFTFVAVNDGLTVMRGDEVPATAAELAMAQSPLCVAPVPTVTP